MSLLDQATLRILDRVDFTLPPSFATDQQGNHRSKSLSRGVEFADHRPYVAGDDIRSLDWKAYIRSGNLVVRRFEESKDTKLMILLDVSASMREHGKLLVASKVAMSLVYVALKRSDRVLFFPFGDQPKDTPLKHMKGLANLPHLEELLLELKAVGVTSLETTMRTWASHFSAKPSKGILWIISDFMCPHGWTEGASLAQKLGFQTHMCHIASQADHHPQHKGELELLDSETEKKVRVAIDPALLKAYQEVIQTHLDQCRDAIKPTGGVFHSIPTEAPFHESILDFFMTWNRMTERGHILR